MTIKCNGGIFGRNPTFNNVTVDGVLTVDQIVEKTGAAGITLDGVTLKDGNVVLANGKGIDFSATPGTGTSELFDDYEEGTWTPSWSQITLGNATSSGHYTKIGDVVYATAKLVYGSTSSLGSGNVIASNLPFTSANKDVPWGVVNILDQGVAGYIGSCRILPNTANVDLFVNDAFSTYVRNVRVTTGVPMTWATGDTLEFSITYHAA
jgi:hypothetical protein